MKIIKRVSILPILVLISFLLVSCDMKDEEMSESKTYSNVYYTIKYPSNWREPELIAPKVFFLKDDNKCSLDIKALPYKDSIEDLIPKDESEECIIDGNKGYKVKIEENNEIITFYLIQKNDMLFEMMFKSQVDDYKNCLASMDQMIKSFEFNDFESMSFANWNQFTIENIEVYYPNNSVINDTIEEWGKDRVEAFNYITEYLDVQWEYEPIKMYVFDSEEHGEQYGLQLGFALPGYNHIFTLHNQYPGHELAHCVSYYINNGERIDSALINEGLATHLNMTGKDYHRMTADILQEKSYTIKLLGDDFRKNEDAYTFGASFVKYLIDKYSLELFKEFFAQNQYNEEESFREFYDKEGNVLVNEWMDYLKTY
ncbi:hypothetical protein [Vallitalea okinawensis]|uniref:hypothetical protein n=1 Tax=Vallitalea okinawensis TaxID=2078660 RepID=UPI000CFD4FE9|nr:hypothetical protein [Vallitalea okinawensis]